MATLSLALVIGLLVGWREVQAPSVVLTGEVIPVPPVLPPPPVAPTAVPRSEPRPQRGRVLLVLDDAGYHTDRLKAFLSLPFDFAVAIIPFLPESELALRLVREAGKIPMLHMPMQPSGRQDPGQGALLTSDSPGTIRRKLLAALDSLPGVVGVNNHMGSLFTAQPEQMRTVLQTLAERGLFYLDSYTSAQSSVRGLEREVSIRLLRRDIFLDHEASESFLERALGQALELARRQGTVVMIGHVQTLALVEKLRRFHENHGHELDFVSPGVLLSGRPRD